MNINFEVKRHRLSATQGEAEVFAKLNYTDSIIKACFN